MLQRHEAVYLAGSNVRGLENTGASINEVLGSSEAYVNQKAAEAGDN